MSQVDINNLLAIDFLERFGVRAPTQRQIDWVELLTANLINQATLEGLIGG